MENYKEWFEYKLQLCRKESDAFKRMKKLLRSIKFI
jgi:hypothetical protein